MEVDKQVWRERTLRKGAIHYAEDQQNPDDVDRDEFLLQRMPDIQLAGLPMELPGAPSLPGALGRAVDGNFADDGIDGIPDALERDEQGRRVLADGSIELADGTITTADEILAQNMDPTVDPLTLLPTPDGSGETSTTKVPPESSTPSPVRSLPPVKSSVVRPRAGPSQP